MKLTLVGSREALLHAYRQYVLPCRPVGHSWFRYSFGMHLKQLIYDAFGLLAGAVQEPDIGQI